MASDEEQFNEEMEDTRPSFLRRNLEDVSIKPTMNLRTVQTSYALYKASMDDREEIARVNNLEANAILAKHNMRMGLRREEKAIKDDAANVAISKWFANLPDDEAANMTRDEIVRRGVKDGVVATQNNVDFLKSIAQNETETERDAAEAEAIAAKTSAEYQALSQIDRINYLRNATPEQRNLLAKSGTGMLDAENQSIANDIAVTQRASDRIDFMVKEASKDLSSKAVLLALKNQIAEARSQAQDLAASSTPEAIEARNNLQKLEQQARQETLKLEIAQNEERWRATQKYFGTPQNATVPYADIVNGLIPNMNWNNENPVFLSTDALSKLNGSTQNALINDRARAHLIANLGDDGVKNATDLIKKISEGDEGFLRRLNGTAFARHAELEGLTAYDQARVVANLEDQRLKNIADEKAWTDAAIEMKKQNLAERKTSTKNLRDRTLAILDGSQEDWQEVYLSTDNSQNSAFFDAETGERITVTKNTPRAEEAAVTAQQAIDSALDRYAMVLRMHILNNGYNISDADAKNILRNGETVDGKQLPQYQVKLPPIRHNEETAAEFNTIYRKAKLKQAEVTVGDSIWQHPQDIWSNAYEPAVNALANYYLRIAEEQNDPTSVNLKVLGPATSEEDSANNAGANTETDDVADLEKEFN